MVTGQIQPNGICWECGGQAVPTYKQDGDGGAARIGWSCMCGRWWPARGEDVTNWARAHVRIQDGDF